MPSVAMDSEWHNIGPGIMSEIFACCTREDLASCARTCKRWSNPALDQLWSSIFASELVNLFAILAPLALAQIQASESKSLIRMSFTRHITQLDWKRFLSYAERVKTLEAYQYDTDRIGNESKHAVRVLSETSLTDLLMTKPATIPILPRLQTLIFDGEFYPEFPWCKFLAGFLHDGLRNLDIYIPHSRSELVTGFLEEACWRSPNITNLEIETDLEAFTGGVEASLLRSLPTMRKLTKVVTPSCLVTPKILSSLEQLPDLLVVASQEGSYRVGRKASGCLPQPPVLPHSFSSLETIALQCSLEELNRYLSAANGAAPRLRDLTVDVISTNDTKTFRECFARIADVFPLLESLTITRLEDYGEFGEGDGSIFTLGAHLTFNDFAPLTKMRNLRKFLLRYCEPVSMTDDQLFTLLCQCPTLTVLELNQEPMILSSTKLTINVLPLLAKACPKLESLALYVDTNVEITETAAFYTFERLSQINLGISSLIYNDRGVLPLLAQVLPEDCKIVTESPYPQDVQDVLDPGGEQGRQSRRKAWAKVANWMPILMDVRCQSTSRARQEHDQSRTLSASPELVGSRRRSSRSQSSVKREM